jgi:hypothetical protein
MRMALHKKFVFCSGLNTFRKFVENVPDIACETDCGRDATVKGTADANQPPMLSIFACADDLDCSTFRHISNRINPLAPRNTISADQVYIAGKYYRHRHRVRTRD